MKHTSLLYLGLVTRLGHNSTQFNQIVSDIVHLSCTQKCNSDIVYSTSPFGK